MYPFPAVSAFHFLPTDELRCLDDHKKERPSTHLDKIDHVARPLLLIKKNESSNQANECFNLF